ncbi:pesticin domain-containing protein [Naegleria gruberi]|uniref:Pesticin domain-containing protein n=1 Tax=Naegleria gruberi TaxID=5762 RepID=D2VKR5_NAEGR|nr:pesticin domain-containing protein [Naegleria gruberi]EFC42638.1 pesticin domain-containing protein [Naegleria gruberi]|eukprot:XP_002675382.1 pesticin domain-containing protein [Naegleria gruberi strain NEG-M]
MVLCVSIMAVSGSFLEQIVEMSLSDSRSFKSGGGSSGGGSKSGSSSSSSGKSSSKSSSSSSKSTSSSKTSTSKSYSKSTVSSKMASAYSQYANSRIAGMKNPASTMAGLKAANLNARLSAQPTATVNGKLTAAGIKASYQNRLNTRVAAAYQQYAQSRMAAAKPTAKPTNIAAAYQQYAQSRIAGMKNPASTLSKPTAKPANIAAAYQQYAQSRIAGLKNPASTLPGSFKIDKGLLTVNEGKPATTGYVPQSKAGTVIGKSGVTVGTGFDVGQQNVKGLKALGLSPSLVDKLSPYTGLKQQAAKDFLAKNPLSLSPAEVASIDKAVMDKFSANLAKDYAAAAAKNPTAVKNFKDLPAPVQSVAYSVYHQYGSFSKTPSFMNKLATNDYNGMVHELRNFGDSYSTRRNREADHLESGLKAASG